MEIDFEIDLIAFNQNHILVSNRDKITAICLKTKQATEHPIGEPPSQIQINHQNFVFLELSKSNFMCTITNFKENLWKPGLENGKVLLKDNFVFHSLKSGREVQVLNLSLVQVFKLRFD